MLAKSLKSLQEFSMGKSNAQAFKTTLKIPIIGFAEKEPTVSWISFEKGDRPCTKCKYDHIEAKLALIDCRRLGRLHGRKERRYYICSECSEPKDLVYHLTSMRKQTKTNKNKIKLITR